MTVSDRLEIARHFSLAGSDLGLVARGGGQLEGVARAARVMGRAVLEFPADLTDLSVAGAVVEETVSRFGRLDVLVNNASGAAARPFLETTAQDLDEAFHFNVAASVELERPVFPDAPEAD